MENITVNMENLTEEERKQLLALVEKGNKPKSKVWKPKNGEKYFCILSDGRVCSYTWESDSFDNDRYNLGNCFKTKEEAEFALEKRKIEAELKRFAEEHNEGEIDWNKETPKYYIWYSYIKDAVGAGNYFYSKDNIVYFTSEKIAEQAIQEIGEERLKKYYFEAKMN